MSHKPGHTRFHAISVQSDDYALRSSPDDHDPSIKRRKSWRAPATMISSFVIGIGIALAHHFTYAYLDHRPVESINASQAWISRIGTGLAFAVKLALGTCVGVAFIQHQWLRLREQTFRVCEIDCLTSILGNFLALFDSSVWLRQPTLTLMALSAWTIPLSAVVAPGSLAVNTLPVSNITQLPVPQLNYSGEPIWGSIGGIDVSGPLFESGDLTKLAFSTAASGQPAAIEAHFTNQTYQLTFAGPAVRCSPGSDDMVRRYTTMYGPQRQTGNNTPYLAWVGGDEKNMSSSLNATYETFDQTSTDAARIFFMTNSGLWNETLPVVATDGYVDHFTTVNITECLLYNVTYLVDFTFQGPKQARAVSIKEWLNPVFMALGKDIWHAEDGPAATSYACVMSAFGRLLAGTTFQDHYGSERTVASSWKIVDIDWIRAEAVRSGLEQLFQNITLSLMSDDSLIKNSSSAALIPVTVTTWPVTYVYTRFDLLLPYGLATLAALLCTLIGARAFFINQASYQNLFSTFVRATNNGTKLKNAIRDHDTGADPLPKELARATVLAAAHHPRDPS